MKKISNSHKQICTFVVTAKEKEDYNEYMSSTKEQRRKHLRRLLPKALLYIGVLAVLYALVQSKDLDVHDLIQRTPENRVLAAFVMLVFYALKSLSVFIPVPLLYIATGMLFPKGTAVLVNTLGLIVATGLPYALGRINGAKSLHAYLDDSDALRRIKIIQTDNPFFSTYMLRMCQLPMDLVSAFLGTQKIPYARYLAGTLCGMAPVMLGITLMSENLLDPSSIYFKRSVLIMILLIAGSMLWFALFLKRRYPEKAKEIKKEVEQSLHQSE